MSPNWPRLAAFLIIGYLAYGRTFAYLGFPPAKLFLGEICLAAFLALRSDLWYNPIRQIFSRRTPLDPILWPMLLFIAYGAFLVIYGIREGYYPLLAIQAFAFHYYTLYLFLGLAIARFFPRQLHPLLLVAAWIHGLYGLSYALYFGRFETFTVPGLDSVTVYGQPTGSAYMLLALLCIDPTLRKSWIPFFLNLFALLALQVRAEWAGFIIGLLVWGIFARRFKHLLSISVVFILLIAFAYVIDLRIPGAATRGGEISIQGILGRSLAPLDPKLAANYVDKSDEFAGTVSWRTDWWQLIWQKVHRDTQTTLIGFGYGFPIATLAPHIPEDVRSPHSIFYYCLSQGGWLSVILFSFFQIQLLRGLYHVSRLTDDPFPITFWTAGISVAFFGDFLETPYGAIPFYLLIGMSLAPLLKPHASPSPQPSPLLSSTAYWKLNTGYSLP